MSDSPNDVESVFLAALEKATPDERIAYLDQACGGDGDLRNEVDALLQAHESAGSFLGKPPAGLAAISLTDASSGAYSDDGEMNLDFLEPCDKPDRLGCLGHYEITEVVGRGGMGIVLKGHDPKLSRVVAVKVLAPELASGASASKRFLREGRAAAAVSHDHVVTIYGIDDSRPLPFIAMEYVSGPSLEDRIKSEGTLELTEILRIGMQIASGLAAAHAQGLVHRDVKPANILLENGVEKVKITDFGLARAVDDVRMTNPGVVTGTPEYMSPEQARGESVDHRTDLFSLGSVLYAMCTGRSPFRAENTVAMIRRVCEDTPRPIQDVNADVAGWLIQIIDRLLVKSAADRYQSASELAEILSQCLAHLQEPSINPLPDGLEGQKGTRVARRRATTRRRGWLAAAAVLLLMLGGLSLTEATGVTNVAGAVIRIVRGDGTLVIQVDDPGVSVSIDGEQLVITGAGAKEIRLAVGQHELKAVKGGKPVYTESVTITRDGKKVVSVQAEPLPPAEVAEAPETEADVGVELQEVWSFAGLDGLNVLTISRDGRYCVLLEPATGALAVRDLTTGEQWPTERTAHNILRASISPDNQWVAYTKWYPEEGYGLRIVGIDGSQERVLYPNEEKSQICLMGWSPDSQHVLATFYETRGERIAWASVAVRIATVSVADGSTSVLNTLTPVEQDFPNPRFSPDGRYVAYGRVMDTASEQEDIFLIPLDGRPEIHLVQSLADDDVLGWLPDGKSFLFRSDRRGEGDDVWMIRVADGKPQGAARLIKKGLTGDFIHDAAFLGGPVWTPTGGWAFYHSEGGQTEYALSYTATLDPDTGRFSTAPKLIAEPTAGRERVLFPDFSRDGKYLAYYVGPAIRRSPKGPLYGPGNIVIRSLETGQEREITLSPKLSSVGSRRFLRWAPDGRSILVFGCTETLATGIYRVDIDSGKLTPVVLEPEQTKTDWQLQFALGRVEGDALGLGELSPDGRTLFFPRWHIDPNVPREQRRSRCRIVARDLESGQEREIYRDPDGVFSALTFAASPDGQRVVIRGNNASLLVIPTTGGEPRELLKLGRGFGSSNVRWTPDSRYLLIVKHDDKGTELWRIAAEGGELERLVALPPRLGVPRIWSLRVHPDGRQFAFDTTRWVQQSRIRMLQIVYSKELAKEMCTANLRKIGKAIEQHKNDHDDVPDGFSDLYPDYLQDNKLLLCPADRTGGIRLAGAKDPKMRCSYRYMFGPGTQGISGLDVALPVDFPAREGMTWKDARKLQMEYFGPVVPIVQCRHHSQRMFSGYGGDIYEAEYYWEESPRAGAELLNHLKVTMKTDPDTWAQRYDTQRFLGLLRYAEGDEAALAKLLETHLKEHPDDEVARKFLDELPRLRFISRYEDDAEEYGDGEMPHLDSFDLELIQDDESGDQVVGIRFQEIPVPQGARIKRAHVQFTAYPEEPGSEKTDLVLHAERAANAEPFAAVKHNITSRRKTAASVKWSPEPWTVGGERSEKQRTPDLASLVQEVVNQPDWQEGNALVLIISGSGRRNAQSWDGGWSGTPMLYVEH